MTPADLDPLDAMQDELAAADVHVGFPDEREALARLLLGAGVSQPDVAALAAHCRETVQGTGAAARVLVSILADHRKREARIVDLRRVQEAKARRAPQPERAFGDAPYVPGPTEGEPPEVWDHDRQCRMAWCRVHGDRASHETVARELGVSTTTLGVMLDRGRVLSQSPITADAKAAGPGLSVRESGRIEKQERERHDEFRARMRSDAIRGRTTKGRPAGIQGFDWTRMAKEQGAILARVRTDGVVDLAAVLRDPVKRGALATLEAEGHILRAGEVDARQCQPYRAATNEQERASFAMQIRVWGARRRGPGGEALAGGGK